MTTSSREEEIRQDIERTREQLGDTVEALAHKIDVPARVKETMHVKAEEVTRQVQAKAEEVTQHVLESTGAVQSKVAEVSQRAEQLIDQGLDKLPPPVAARIEPLMAALRQRPLLVATVVVGVLWVLRRLLRRNR